VRRCLSGKNTKCLTRSKIKSLIVLMFTLARCFAVYRASKIGAYEMPFDAGVVDATPTRRIVHFQYIDSEGKPRTDSYDVSAATTDAQINALSVALGAITNASLWNVGYTNWYAVEPAQKGNAVDETNDSVYDNLVILMKDAINNSFDFYVPANNEAVSMVADTENPDPTTTEMVALFAAIDGIWNSYIPFSVRYTERKNTNKAVKL